MALTLACAKCHDHKFNPVSQKEFYELYSFFNNINETGQISWDMAMPVPTLMLPTERQEQIIQMLENLSKEKKEIVQNVAAKQANDINRWVRSGSYRKIKATKPSRGPIASLRLDINLINMVNPGKKAFMERQFSKSEFPH